MPRRARRMLALDTEDDSEGAVQIINVFDGRHHQTFTRAQQGDTFRETAWNWLYAHAPAHLWACNAEYDLVNLCGDWVGLMCTLQYVSSGLLRASFRDVPITVFDTLRHWPMSVEQMGAFLGMEKVWGDETNRFDVAHCRRDTEIVWRFVDQMLRRYDGLGLTLRATLPSMALQLFQKKFYKSPFPRVPEGVVNWLRAGYYGGRVEVYRFGPVPGPVRHYDVNSLFPSVMVGGVYPDPATWRMVGTPDLGKEGMATVLIRVPETAYPVLPVRGETDILYPYGVLSGTWPYPELRQAVADGAEILRCAGAVEFDVIPTPFKGYVEYCYAKRKAAIHPMENVVWKLFMNSLYGKFGQRPGLEMIYQDETRVLETEPGPAANVVWAAYVTCLARLRLLEYLRGTTTCYYTDTDSLFTPDILSVGTHLGALKLEGVYAGMEAVGNKLYTFTVEGPHGSCKMLGLHAHYKAKGVKGDTSERGRQVVTVDGQTLTEGERTARDFIRTGRAVYRKPARLRESRRGFAVANKWYEVEKRRNAVYTKRIIHRDGTTEPWEWSRYQREHQL